MTLNFTVRTSPQRVVLFVRVHFGPKRHVKFRRCHKSDFKFFTAEFIQ